MARARGIKQPHPLVSVSMARSRGIKQRHPLGSVRSRSGVSQLTAESGIATSGLPGVKISALPAASAANDIDQLEVNQAGTSRRVTLDQVVAMMSGATGFAPTDSPVFTGDPTAPTPLPGDDDQSIPTTGWVNDTIDAAIAEIPPPEAGGTTILDGVGAPTLATGDVGNYYVDTTGNTLYGPKFEPGFATAEDILVRGTSFAFSPGVNSLANDFKVLKAGQIIGGSFYRSATSGPTTRQMRLYDTTTQTLLATSLASVETGGVAGWIDVTFAAPVAVAVNQFLSLAYDENVNYAYTGVVPTPTNAANAIYIGIRYGVSGSFPNSGTGTSGEYFTNINWQPATSGDVWPVAVDGDAGSGGSGTVTSTSVVSANGLAGTVATATTTPAITLSTTITGVLKGNGTAISAAVAGTDYMTPANVSAAYQPLDADLTALAGLSATAGLVEQTGAAAFTKRAMGVAAATDVLTRAGGDARYATLSGSLLQMVSTQTGAVATGTTAIPLDDTIPQQTEGDQYMSLSITPKSTTSNLVINVIWNGSNSNIGTVTVALFKDSAANAIAVTSSVCNGAGFMMSIPLRHVVVSGTMSAITYKVRVGQNSATTVTFNGAAGARVFGAAMASSIVIQEVSV